MKTEKNKQQIPAFEVIQEVKKAVIGKDECIVKAVAAILAGGHILLNDIPGVGKLHVSGAEPRTVYAGCSALRPDRVFYVSERNWNLCVSAGKRHVQSSACR